MNLTIFCNWWTNLRGHHPRGTSCMKNTSLQWRSLPDPHGIQSALYMLHIPECRWVYSSRTSRMSSDRVRRTIWPGGVYSSRTSGMSSNRVRRTIRPGGVYSPRTSGISSDRMRQTIRRGGVYSSTTSGMSSDRVHTDKHISDTEMCHSAPGCGIRGHQHGSAHFFPKDMLFQASTNF